ncbi:helix-turn-helix domain-containing protein [Ammoniphilus sp. CFH 90114]|uniref:response regulator transcription factor n=1 Tax=Ammoniphilus sp. CFH 90114 TaxID=2493665 RepID=UPI00100E2248|nr:helix-turn-helix domain-containing protein [Ammoniphilus sp. CFH 90114]RXT03749.1 response regulator [Ammoniphilus sp. CFH 90114]
MKVLIVDDEKHVREAIKLLVPWEEYDITSILEAQNVEAAKELIQKENPEILFLDMMIAGETGSELLQWTYEQSMGCKVIIVSGFNDFHFVRNAMRYNGVDYILKPIDEQQIIQALEKAIEQWKDDEFRRQEHQSKNKRMDQIEPLYWDKVLSDFIQEPVKHLSMIQELNPSLDHTACRVQISLLSLQMIHSEIYKSMLSNKDLLYVSISKVCNGYLNRYGCGYAFRNWAVENEVVLLVWDQFDRMKFLLEEINQAIYHEVGSRFFFAMGSVQSTLSGVDLSYQKARKVLKEKINLKKPGGFIFEESQASLAESDTLYLNQYEEKLLFAMKNKDAHILTSVTERLTNEVRSLPSITLSHIDIWQNELEILKLKHFKRYALNQVDLKMSYLKMNDKGELLMEDWLGELRKSLLNLHQTISHSSKERLNVIGEIAKYIDKHYHEDLTLQCIAEQFYLSREHISRKFKLEFGSNLFDYLISVRIEKAKALLTDPGLRVSDISKMVGYEDEKYFSKVFKKVTGYSPSQYRNHLIQPTY